MSNPQSADGQFRLPNWGNGVTVGAKLDLDENTMEFTFNGETSGIAFSGFDPQDGLFPCVSLNQNTTCTINLGKTPFKYPEVVSLLGYSPIEHDAIRTSSWLTRYALASEVTGILDSRKIMPERILADALQNEASLEHSHDMTFEVAKSDAPQQLNIDNILIDSALSFNPAKPNNLHLTFKVSGVEDQEFVLRSVTIRYVCGTKKGNLLFF